ncbi:MAG: hypothetical protein KGZ85_05580 [Ignavibacterium sp.]|nr:hypothetical protein [Ignavibacterium sp.]
MTSEQLKHKSIFKYNTSFYYQSTIIYFVVFSLYLIIRGEIVDNSYTLVIKDPILYFLAIIVVISIFALILNLYKRRYIEIDQNGITFVNRFKRKEISSDKIGSIRVTNKRNPSQSKGFQLIILKLKTRKRRLLIRPTDYENYDELLKRIQELKLKIESK